MLPLTDWAGRSFQNFVGIWVDGRAAGGRNAGAEWEVGLATRASGGGGLVGDFLQE